MTISLNTKTSDNPKGKQTISILSGEIQKAKTQEGMELKKTLSVIEQLTKELEDNLQEELGNLYKIEQDRLCKIVQQMQSGADFQGLLDNTVIAVRQNFQASRVLIYKFDNDYTGKAIAESMVNGYTPSLNEMIPALCFGMESSSHYSESQYIAIQDVGETGITPYQKQLFDKYQIKSSLAIPVFYSGQIWGLLVVQQCAQSRPWTSSKINLLYQVTLQLTLELQPLEFKHQLQQQTEREKAITRVTQKIQQSLDFEKIFQITVKEVRRYLNADRVGVFRFYPESNYDLGQFLCEDVQAGFSLAVPAKVNDHCFGSQFADKYRSGGFQAVGDIYNAGLSDCHVEILSQFEIRANLVVPVLKGNMLWGLLCIHQCSGPRYWSESEISFCKEIANQFGIALQQAEYLQQAQEKARELEKAREQEKVTAQIVDRIRQASDVSSLYQVTVKEVRRYLSSDRVAVFQFLPDSGYNEGEFVSSEQIGDFTSALNFKIHDHCFGSQYAEKYRNGEFQAIADVYNAGLSNCHLELLTPFQIRANLIVPVLTKNNLWGLLCVHQCSGPREWKESEINFVQEIAAQFGVELQQAEYLKQAQDKARELEKARQQEQVIARIVERIRQASDVSSLYQITVKEVRRYLNSDRVAVFELFPDSGYNDGQFIAEDVQPGFTAAVNFQVHDHCFGSQYAEKYRNGAIQAIADIYNAGLSDCHIEVLTPFQVRANLIVPVLTRNNLWGLLCIHQCSGPREWKESEISFAREIAIQFGIALQQAEYLKQAQDRALELERARQQEQVIARIVERIRQALDLPSLFQITVKEVRRYLNVDRVGVFRFYPESNYDLGQFLCEDVQAGFSLAVPAKVHDHCFGSQYSEKYRTGGIQAVSDIYNARLSDCHIEILAKFEIRANLVIPVLKGNDLWGLLCIHQCSGPRMWTELEIGFAREIATQFGIALQQAEYLEQIQTESEQVAKLAQREASFVQVLSSIGQRIAQQFQQRNLDPIPLFNATNKELLKLFKSDRVAVYRFNSDWSGEFISESVSGGSLKLVGTQLARVSDPEIQSGEGGGYKHNKSLAIANVYVNEEQNTFGLEFLEEIGVKAYMVVPIFKGEILWGLVTVYDHNPRTWETAEVNFLQQVGVQLGIAVLQSESLQKIESQSEQLSIAAEKEKAAKEKLQQGVLQLLNAVRPVFSGDLTIRIPVTEDEIGTMAGAYNSTLQSLRQIVIEVKGASEKVSVTTEDSAKAIERLATEAQQQYQELRKALKQVQEMLKATHLAAQNTQKVEQAVVQANQTLQKGDSAMNQTVDGILEIRETVSETSKRIKRLSESSQKISKVVNLISNFANQTNILALNAAIEATRAGEYGKGFAVVADEVRNLAHQSASATTEIEKLVQEIQSETQEVALAMEMGIQQVQQGTNIVNETRQSLNEIVAATADISQLLKGISKATSIQNQQAKLVTQVMTQVASVANKTSGDSLEISASFKELLSMANNLQTSVGQFKVL